MKIEKLTIKNFRIFNGLYEFDFSNRDLVIVNGPNGNGKSTIFDSIQWCLTGKIPRYEGSNERNKFNYIMNEKIFKKKSNQTMYVEIVFTTDEGIKHTVRRTRNKNREGRFLSPKVSVNKEPLNNKDGADRISQLLKDSNFFEDELDINQENTLDLSTFFSSTQLLSQDALEDFIKIDKPHERYKLIDSILGVRKYGADFEKFIDFMKETAKQQQEKLLRDLEEPKQRFRRLNVEIIERERMISDTGQLSEQDVALEVKNLIQQEKSLLNSAINFNLERFEFIDEKLLEELVKLRDIYISRISHCRDLKDLLQKSKKVLELSLEDMKSKRNNMKKEIDKLHHKMNKREASRQKAISRKAYLQSLKVRRSRYQDLKQDSESYLIEINQKEAHIQELLAHPDLLKVKEKFVEFKLFIEQYRENIKSLETINECLNYKDLVTRIKRIKANIEKDNNDFYSIKKTLTVKEEELDQLKKKIVSSNGELSQKKEGNIEQLVRQIQEHLLRSVDNSHCLVCGADYKMDIFLKKQVTKQIDEFNRNLSEMEREILNLKTAEGVCLEEIKNNERQMKTIQKRIDDNNQHLQGLLVNHAKMKNRLPEMKEFATKNEISIGQRDEFKEFLDDYKLSFNLFEEIKRLREDIEKTKSKNDTTKKLITKVKNETSSLKKYLDLEEYYISEKINRISNYSSKVKEEKVALQQKISSLNEQILNFDASINDYELYTQKIKKKIPEFHPMQLDSWILLNEKELYKIETFENNLGKKLINIRNFIQKDQISQLRKDFVSLDQYLKRKDKVLKEYEIFINNEIETLKSKHVEIRSNLVANYLLQHSQYIDKIFAQITPHAVYRHVQLVPKGKNLYIVLTKEPNQNLFLRDLDENELKEQFNASLKFSSGQANVLALCIFLALNYSQKWTNLKFLGIDDPFQNLDDINIFSFLDVLNQIVFAQRKQILISTHNDKFANLLKAKIGLDRDKVGVIQFRGYNEDEVIVKGNCVSSNIESVR
ncbi:AAA family ATPase [Priestia megaterium]|uniref:AAA family ATPase n=1 Tax=Priestia megaterium TaxID=1404 RepID=UPI000BF887C1|nr:SMC family ATPase [Priestia megaterium]PFW47271.1 hypothetical protein COL17_22110 [Priestia megaterium]